MRLTVRSGPRPASIPSKIFLTLFLSLFLGAGLFMAWFIGRGVYRTVRSYSWPQTSCRILESRVAEEPKGRDPYLFQVRFRYEVAGRSYESNVYKPTYTGSDQIADAQRLADRYPVDSQATCYVDPAAPEKASLARASLWSVLVLLFPAVFILVGAGGIAATWKFSPTPAAAAGDAAISEGERKAPSTRMALGCLIGFLSLFGFAGLGTGLFFIVPAWKSLTARSWPQADCTVISSAVRSHPGSKSTTYSVDILYEYAIGGKTHRSNRYEFLGGSSGGYAAKEEIVRQNPPGLTRKCRVNPEDPNEAVLSIGFGKQYLPAIVPAVFMLVGFGGIALAVKAARSRAASPATFGADGRFVSGDAGPGLASAAGLESGPVTLKTTSPVGKLFGMIFVALFWNGIVSAFLWQVVVQWRQGGRPWGMMLFLTPFVLIGLALLFGVVYTFLGLFNPRPKLELSRQSIPLGTSASLRWSFTGAASRLTRLEIRLEGREEARYRRGTSSFTDRNTFLSIPVFDSPEADRIREGSARVSVPADTMHSFSAANNKILWRLKLQGSIPRWPDVIEELDVVVEPSGRAS